MRRLVGLFVPEGVVLAVIVGALTRPEVRGVLPRTTAIGVAAVFVVALLLAARFHRGRLLLAILVVGGAAFAVHASAALDPAERTVIGAIVAVLVAGVLTWLAFARDAAAFGTVGRRRIGTVAFLTVGGALVVLSAPRVLAATPALEHWLPLLRFTDVTVLGAAGIALVTWGLARPDPTTRGLLWSLVVTGIALRAPTEPPVTIALFGAAGIVLLIAVVEVSYALAFRDALTGLPGRRAFDDALRGLEPPYTIAMVDVDHFKQINDRFGHDVGDQVLRMVATRLGAAARGARVFRYGGEEFAALFTNRALDDCVATLETMREAVEESSFSLRARKRPKKKPERPRRSRGVKAKVTVTVSIGAAEPSGRDPRPEGVLASADTALYRAKRGGRNRLAR